MGRGRPAGRWSPARPPTPDPTQLGRAPLPSARAAQVSRWGERHPHPRPGKLMATRELSKRCWFPNAAGARRGLQG